MSKKNIRVFCRFRPLNTNEIVNGSERMITIPDSNNVSVRSNENKQVNKFKFDHIFGEDSTQEKVYQIVGKPLVEEILEGYNATIFAYGQSSSGKTTTMTGYSQLVDNNELLARDDVVLWRHQKDMGIVPRLIQELFETIKNKQGFEFSIQVSYVEIYLEKIRDLLNPRNDNLEIRENRYKGLWVENVKEVYVSSFEEAIKVMRQGELNRTVASTAMNAHSSRSHSILIVNLHKTSTKTQEKTMSRMVFVDLAGSEKIEKTKAEGLILKQAQATNKSLLTLGLVIRALVDKNVHVPYRDSKLTRLLTDSLGGNSKTHLIVTCSPAQYNIEETISTLRFGNITKQIENQPRVNREMSIEEYKKQLLQANEKILTQQRIIEALQKDLDRLIKLSESRGLDVKEFKKEYNIDPILMDDGTYENGMEKLYQLSKEIEAKTNLITELQRAISQNRDEVESLKDEVESLKDDLYQKQQDLDNRILESDQLSLRITDLERMYDTLQKQIEEGNEKSQLEIQEILGEKNKIEVEISILKSRISQLVEENQTLRENSLRTWKNVEPSNMINEEYEKIVDKYNKLLIIDEERKQLLEAKLRHISILEDNLQLSKTKHQENESEHKKRYLNYDKKIKDLESQIRILKNSTQQTNIITPLKY